MTDPLAFLRKLFDRAVEVADPMRSLSAYLPPKPNGRVVVVGAGKASARMAEAVEAAWGPCEGLVITRYGYARPCQGIEIVEAAHPVPDEAGLEAARRMMSLLGGLGEDDYVLALISGGASALLTLPGQGLNLAQKQEVNSALLASGAPISEMNTVRKHLSGVKGGQLAAQAYPARMDVLMISDVPGDDPAMIGSGPTVGDDSSPAEAAHILARLGIVLPNGAELVTSTVLKPGDPRLSKTRNQICAAPSQSLQAAEEMAQEMGFTVTVLGDALEGEARDVARDHAALICAQQTRMKPGDAPHLFLSGGELTVTRRGDGCGGPNAEYLLALTLELDGRAGIYALACDTDGVDGAAEVAGAVCGPDTLKRAVAANLSARDALRDNDAHSFFEKTGQQVITGPTLTNVNDFHAVIVQPL